MTRPYTPLALRAGVLVLLVAQLTACTVWDRYRESASGPGALLNPARITPKDPRASATIKNDWSKSTRPSEFDQFYRIEQQLACAEQRIAEPAECVPASGVTVPKLRQQYEQEGIVLSDTVCYAWFDLLERAQANTQFWKNNVVITAATATTVMGAVDAAAKEIAVVAAAFAGANAGFENFQSTFLFSPDMHTIRKTISGLREEARRTMFQPDSSSYEESKRRLLHYHEICSGSTIRELIQTAVVKSNYEFNEKNWTTKITGGDPNTVAASTEAKIGIGEFMNAWKKATGSFTTAAVTGDADADSANTQMQGIHQAVKSLWEKLPTTGTALNQTQTDEIARIVGDIANVREPVTLVNNRAGKSGASADLIARAKTLSQAQADLDGVAKALKALEHDYAAAATDR